MGKAVDIEILVGANIKARREAAGLSQASLAELASMSTTSVYRIEAAERWPRPENVKALARALKCTESELFSSGDESGVPPKLLELIASAAREAGLKVSR